MHMWAALCLIYNEYQSSLELRLRYQERDWSLYLLMSGQFFYRQMISEIIVLVRLKVAAWTVWHDHDPPQYPRNFMTACNGEILTYTIALAELSSFDV